MTRPESWQSLLMGLDVATAAPVAPTEAADVDHATVLSRAGIGDFLKAHSGGPITVVVNDTHRLTDTRPFLAALLAAVDEVFPIQSRPELRMLVAAGSHKSDRLERIGHEERIAAPFLKRFSELAWHDSDDAAGLGTVGTFRFHRWMGEAGTYIACGSTEPHYFAGVTGAHKTLTVGVMARADIQENHSHAMSTTASGMRLDGNPIHAGVVSALDALEKNGARLFCLNQVIVDGRVIAATAGHPLAALADAVPTVRRCFTYPVDEPLDLVIARVGPPLDRDLYQADKGIKNTEAAVRSGGLLLLDAECAKGIGIDHFVTLLRAAPSYAEAMMIVQQRGYRLGDHKAVRLRALTDKRKVRIGLVSPHLAHELVSVVGMTVFRDRSDAAHWARGRLSSAKARCLVVEDAGNLTLELASR
jgi:nickel-dependent lactate racemase